MNGHNHWVPRTKYELVEALSRIYPNDRAIAKMPKRQLYAIWFRAWKGTGCQRCR
jgi:hypothetical protein